MAAEAKIKLAEIGIGSFDSALEYINPICQRAVFKAGEARDEYTDGGEAWLASVLDWDPNNNSFMGKTHIMSLQIFQKLSILQA